MRRLIVLVLLVGCHDDMSPGGDAPNIAPGASLDDLTPGCVVLTNPPSFDTSFDFPPAVADTLADWTPEGRWFLTGTAIQGTSSIFFDGDGARLRIDRDDTISIGFNHSELFARRQSEPGNVVAYRISNLRPDGTLRAERAACLGGSCTVCTAVLVRATHLDHEGEGSGLTLLGEINGPGWGAGYTFNVRVAGTLAYLIRQDGLHVIETADPAHPVELGHYARPVPDYSNDVKLVDAGDRRYALIADTPVDVVDVTDPTAPALVAQITESAHTVFTETRNGKTLAYFGNYGGFAGSGGTCPVYDVTDPAHPVELGRFHTGGMLLHDLSVVDGIAYLNAWDAGFFVVDFTAPASPTLLGTWAPTPIRASHSNWTTTVAGRHIALHGEEGYDAHLNIVDVDP
ncbi:MAG: hypothetical protein ABIY55_27400, partial [Kofleriaceae bacterium]